MMKITSFGAIVALGSVLALPAVAYTQDNDTAPAGTQLAGTMQQPLNTKTAAVGDGFVINETALPNDNPAFQNAKIYGHVGQVTPAGQGRKAQLKLTFDRIVFPDGSAAPLDATVVNMAPSTGSNTTKEVAGAVVGDLVGNYLGKHIGLGIGGLVGAAGGYLYAKNSQNDFTVSQGSTVTLQLNSAIVTQKYRQAPQDQRGPTAPASGNQQ